MLNSTSFSQSSTVEDLKRGAFAQEEDCVAVALEVGQQRLPRSLTANGQNSQDSHKHHNNASM
eukprot:266062-Pelagomonas_calceolata.AAC.1